MSAFLWEFWLFGMKQARSCIFAAAFLFLMLLSHHVSFLGLARYDFLFLAALGLQVVLVLARVETGHEVLVLSAFHAVGLMLELFKTHPAIGSWSYPEEGFFKIGTVPLYSGFMYAAVASYMCQAWRILNLELVGYPRYWKSVPLAVGVYANFFTRHFLPDVRWLLAVAIVLVFRRCHVRFTVWKQRRSMPLVLSFALIGFFIWVAENMATYLGAWVYAEQVRGWRVVSLWIISSWVLLVIVSFIIVADLKHMRSLVKSGHAGEPSRLMKSRIVHCPPSERPMQVGCE